MLVRIQYENEKDLTRYILDGCQGEVLVVNAGRDVSQHDYLSDQS